MDGDGGAWTARERGGSCVVGIETDLGQLTVEVEFMAVFGCDGGFVEGLDGAQDTRGHDSLGGAGAGPSEFDGGTASALEVVEADGHGNSRLQADGGRVLGGRP